MSRLSGGNFISTTPDRLSCVGGFPGSLANYTGCLRPAAHSQRRSGIDRDNAPQNHRPHAELISWFHRHVRDSIALASHQRRATCGHVSLECRLPTVEIHVGILAGDDRKYSLALRAGNHRASKRNRPTVDESNRSGRQHSAAVGSRVAFSNERKAHGGSPDKCTRGLYRCRAGATRSLMPHAAEIRSAIEPGSVCIFLHERRRASGALSLADASPTWLSERRATRPLQSRNRQHRNATTPYRRASMSRRFMLFFARASSPYHSTASAIHRLNI